MIRYKNHITMIFDNLFELDRKKISKYLVYVWR